MPKVLKILKENAVLVSMPGVLLTVKLAYKDGGGKPPSIFQRCHIFLKFLIQYDLSFITP